MRNLDIAFPHARMEVRGVWGTSSRHSSGSIVCIAVQPLWLLRFSVVGLQRHLPPSGELEMLLDGGRTPPVP